MIKSDKILLRSGTAASWSATNPKLELGEIGYEIDTRKIKVGDGEYKWNGLSYIYTGDANAAGTSGQVQFNNGGLLGTNANFFWDNAQSFLGVGTATPTSKLTVRGGAITVGNTDAQVTQLAADGSNVGYVGTTTNTPFAIRTNGSNNRVWVTETGDVGIGNISPSQRLHVSGGNLRLEKSDNPIFEIHRGATRQGYLWSFGGSYLELAADSRPLYLTTGGANPIYFAAGGTEKARLTSTGNLGIGVTSPTYKLDVLTNIRLDTQGTGGALRFESYGNNAGQIETPYVDAQYSTLGIRGTNNVLIYTNGNERFRINSNGDTGIGTSSPSSRLHLSVAGGAPGYGGLLQLERSGGWGAGWVDIQYVGSTFETFLCCDLNTNPTAKISCWQDVWDGGNKPGSIRLYTRPSGGSVTERMRISSTGNVGIGTTTPTEMLDVASAIKVGTNASQVSIIWPNGGALRTGSAGTIVYWDVGELVVREGNAVSAGAKLTVRGTALIGEGSGRTADLTLNNNLAATTIHAYNTYSGAGANYERAKFAWSSNVLQIGTEKLGTGVARTLALQTDGTNRMIVSTTGNIGINQNGSIRGRLDVYGLDSEVFIGNDDAQSLVMGNSRRLNYGDFLIAKNLAGVAASDSYRTVFNSAATGYCGIELRYPGDIAFYGQNGATTGGATVTPTTRMMIKGDTGNVGIGTATPSTLLEVSGTNANNIIRSTTTSNLGTTAWAGVTAHEIQFYNADPSGAGLYSAIRIIGSADSGVAAGGTAHYDYTVWTGGYNRTLAERMRITSAGQIGIGTASPLSRLNVSGPINTIVEPVLGAATNSVAIFANSANTYGLNIVTSGSGVVYLQNQRFDTLTTTYPIIINGHGGNVGIGVTNPSQTLHVSGNVRVTGAYYDSNNSAGTSGQILASTGTGTDWVTLSEITGVDGTGTLNYLSKWTPDGNTIGNSQITDDGTYVVIGSGTSGDKILTLTSLAGGTHLRLKSSNNYDRITFGATDQMYIGGWPHSGSMQFGTNSTERMRIASDGNIGIGSTTPAYKLYAEVNSNTPGNLTVGLGIRNINAGSSADTRLYFGNDISASAGTILNYSSNHSSLPNALSIVNNVSGATSILTFHTNASTERMRIDSSGNVGIGNSTPTERLVVNGNVNAARFISTQATGTAPFTVSSTTAVTNLNADLLDGQHGSYYTNYVQSRLENLVTNGSGLLGNNTNFSSMVFNAVERFSGGGSFTWNGADNALTNDELIPVDIGRVHKFSYYIKLLSKSVPSETPTHYGMIVSYDADGNAIVPYNCQKVIGSTYTTLAAPLNPGDTTITLTDATGWNSGATSHQRSIGFYPYTNLQGYTYPDYTYTRDYIVGAWNQGGITGNVITLAAPYAGVARPAGTKVANIQSGGTYDYIAGGNATTPTTWTKFEGIIGPIGAFYATPVPGQLAVSSDMYSAPNGFRQGVAFVKIGWLLSYNTPVGTAHSAVSAISFGQDPRHDDYYRSVSDGTASSPAFSFANDTDIGIFRPLTNELAFATTGSERFRVDASGNVVIGATSTTERLRVAGGNILLDSGNGVRCSDNFRLYDTSSSIDRFLFSTNNSYNTRSGGSHLFNINGSQIAVLTSSGNMGLGVGSPTARLDIFSGNGYSMLLRNGDSSGGTSAIQVAFGYSGTAEYRHSIRTRHNSGAATNNAIDFWLWQQGVDAAATLGSLRVMTIDGANGGSVGIGTSSPSSKLEVATAVSGVQELFNLKFENAVNAGASIAFGATATRTASITHYVGAADSTGFDLAFNTYVAGSSLTEKMRIKGNGSVGIGSTNPAYKLYTEVNSNTPGNATVGLGIRNINAGTAADTRLYLGHDTSAGAAAIIMHANAHSTRANELAIVNAIGDATSKITFATNNSVERMRIDGAGNVGIGVTSPSEKLHVADSMMFAQGTTALACKSYIINRSVSATAGDTTEIGSFLFTNGAGYIELDIVSHVGAYSISAKYLLPIQYANDEQAQNNVWLLALPVSYSGNYNSNQVNLDINVNNGTATLRLRRVSGAQIGVHAINIKTVGNSVTFTPSTTTATGVSTPTLIYGATALIQRTNKVGINTFSPGSTLDVKGTLRLSGATSGYVGLAPASAAGSTTYTLPSADGTSGQFLRTNGSGTLSWASASAATIYSPTTTTTITELSGEVVVLANATSGSLTVNLPTAVSNTAKITVKKIDSSINTVVIDGNSTQTIDGSLTKTIEFQYTSVTLISNGSNWFII